MGGVVTSPAPSTVPDIRMAIRILQPVYYIHQEVPLPDQEYQRAISTWNSILEDTSRVIQKRRREGLLDKQTPLLSVPSTMKPLSSSPTSSSSSSTTSSSSSSSTTPPATKTAREYFCETFFNRLFDIHPLAKGVFSDEVKRGELVIKTISVAFLERKYGVEGYENLLCKLTQVHNTRGVKAVECKRDKYL